MKYIKAFASYIREWCKSNKFKAFFLCLFLFSLAITNCLFPINERILLSNNGDINLEVAISRIVDKRFSWKSMFADALQIPLQLAWYKVHLKNSSVRYDKNCVEYGPGQPLISIYFKNESLPDKYTTSSGFLTEAPSSTDFLYPVSPPIDRAKGYFVPFATNASFVYKGDSPLHFRVSGAAFMRNVISRDGECAQIANDLNKLTRERTIKEVDYALYATPHWGSWLVKFVIIFLIFLSLASSTLSILDWSRKRG